MTTPEKFGYAQVERALARVFGMPPEVQTGMLRGRLIHLRRLGFGPRGEGRGTRISYDRAAVERWLIALKLEDVGVDPMVVISLIEGTWQTHIAKIVALAAKSRDDIYMVVDYPVLRAAWHTPVIPMISHFKAHEAGRLLKWLSDDRSAAVFNVSSCLRALHRELAGS